MTSNPEINLYAIRHGQSTLNKTPHIICGRSNEAPITEQGVRESKERGRSFYIRGIIPDAVYSSPADRAMHTAYHTLGEMGLRNMPIIIDDDLQELDQGLWTGQLRSEKYTEDVLAQIHTEGKDFAADGGESMNQTGERTLRSMTRIADEHAEKGKTKTIFVFGHGMSIRCLASILEDWSQRKTFTTVVPNAAETLLTYSQQAWNLEYIGQDSLSII